MGRFVRTTCSDCGKVARQIDGALMAGYRPRCVKCGRARLVPVEKLDSEPEAQVAPGELVDEDLDDQWRRKEERVSELAGTCKCGGRFTEDAPLRCPLTRASHVVERLTCSSQQGRVQQRRIPARKGGSGPPTHTKSFSSSVLTHPESPAPSGRSFPRRRDCPEISYNRRSPAIANVSPIRRWPGNLSRAHTFLSEFHYTRMSCTDLSLRGTRHWPSCYSPAGWGARCRCNRQGN